MLVVTLIMRTAHVLAAGVWVGGSVIYLAVIQPALRLAPSASEAAGTIAALFRRVVNVCIGVLVLSGVYLTLDRLSTGLAGTAYFVVLALKVAAALAMILLAAFQAQEARRLAKQLGRLWRVTPRLILALGVASIVLGTLLTVIFDAGLTQ